MLGEIGTQTTNVIGTARINSSGWTKAEKVQCTRLFQVPSAIPDNGDSWSTSHMVRRKLDVTSHFHLTQDDWSQQSLAAGHAMHALCIALRHTEQVQWVIARRVVAGIMHWKGKVGQKVTVREECLEAIYANLQIGDGG